VGFRGIDSVQKLLTDRKVPRCGWFFVRDAVLVKPADKITFKGVTQDWVTEHGTTVTLDGTIPEFFIESVSIFPADQQIARKLKSVPSVISWDIECYSDNHKAMPNPWNPSHAAYIITAVYQQYRKPETRIRKAFVFGNCDYTTPTEADGVSTALVKCDTEMEMIDAFSQFVQDANADILIGYNIFGFDINYLKTRMERCLHSWENMGRLRDNITHTGFTDWSSSAYGKNQMYWIESPGRICVDMMKIIERDYKFSDYKLETVSQALLGKGKNDVTPQEMFRIYEMGLRNEPGCESEMLKVVLYGIQDAVLPIELFEKINGWPFFIESSNVMCVNPMDLFTRGQQLRLLNQFYDKCFYLGFVIDSRKVNIIEAEGAYVVPPKKGLHHNMMTLDFASLYPSIMIAHNIGHDTLVLDDSIPDEHCHVFEWTDEEEKAVNQAGNFEGDQEFVEEILPTKDDEVELDDSGKPTYKIQKTKEGKWRFRFIKVEYGHRSIASTMLVDLLGARKAVRAEQKKVKDSDPMYWEILEQRQKAIKVSCNSVYGMLLAQATGKLPLAEGGICVTFRGRQLNLEMQRLAKDKYGAETVYGDSVTGETPVLVRDLRFGPRYVQIKNLGQDWEDDYHGDKEISSNFFAGLQVWSDKGWTDVRSIIRHKCHKRIMRVITNTGLVDVTEDHSLLNPAGEKVSPKEINVGDRLLHADLPVMRSFFSAGFGTARFLTQVDAARFYLENDLSYLHCNVDFRSGHFVLEWEKDPAEPDVPRAAHR
jgi:DNA polymerase elongation subunit (family B)